MLWILLEGFFEKTLLGSKCQATDYFKHFFSNRCLQMWEQDETTTCKYRVTRNISITRNLEFVLKQTLGLWFPGVKTWCKFLFHLALLSRFALKFHLSWILVWHTHSFEKYTFKAIPPDTWWRLHGYVAIMKEIMYTNFETIVINSDTNI